MLLPDQVRFGIIFKALRGASIIRNNRLVIFIEIDNFAEPATAVACPANLGLPALYRARVAEKQN